jgi:hypothetical protein
MSSMLGSFLEGSHSIGDESSLALSLSRVFYNSEIFTTFEVTLVFRVFKHSFFLWVFVLFLAKNSEQLSHWSVI